MSHLRCLLRMSKECFRMHGPIILQKQYITNVLQGMVLQPSVYFSSCTYSSYQECMLFTYILVFFCRLEAHFQSKVHSILQSGNKVQ